MYHKSSMLEQNTECSGHCNMIVICLFPSVYNSWMREHGGSIVNIVMLTKNGYPGFA